MNLSATAENELFAWSMLVVLFGISFGLARASRWISHRREVLRETRERRLTDFASTMIYFSFLLLVLFFIGAFLAFPAFEGTEPPSITLASGVGIAMVACAVVGYSLEAGFRWALYGVWVISALAITAFVAGMVMTGIVRLVALGMIVLYAAAIAVTFALKRGPRRREIGASAA